MGQAVNDTLQQRSGDLESLYQAVVPRLSWGAFDASTTLDDLARYVATNRNDDRWVTAISGAFRQADNSGGTATVTNASIEAALTKAGLGQGPPTGKSCAETLACTIDDFNSMSVDERRAFVAEFQRLYGARFYSQGKWNNIDGVLRFFGEDHLGKPGSWESWVDSSILHGFERGAAMALGQPGGDQGNPGADHWLLYFNAMRSSRGTLRKSEQDRLWSEGEQASTEHGYGVAFGHWTFPGLPELSFAGGGEAYRWILRHEGQIDQGLETAGQVDPLLRPFTQLGREALHDFTDPANPYPSYLGGHIMHAGGQVLQGVGESEIGFTTANPLLLGKGVVDTVKGGGEMVRYGGEAVARGAGWLWKRIW
jgi:hypothetical protein